MRWTSSKIFGLPLPDSCACSTRQRVASPIPLFIVTAKFDRSLAGKLQAAFAAAAMAEDLQPQRDALLIADFVTPHRTDYEELRERAQAVSAHPDEW
jgi:ABC-type phosphate/phosphonate transport system substrate-binding protein